MILCKWQITIGQQWYPSSTYYLDGVMDSSEISNESADVSNHCIARHCWLFAMGCCSFLHHVV